MNKSISKLKEQARVHEQNEEWAEAIKAYQQVLRIAEEGEGEVELNLLNRIGDLFLRDGNSRDAIHYYELAADRYEAAGLYNSAIALCNKVIRQDSTRAEPYYRLGRLTLAQGFLSEARRWSVEYAERMIRAGKRSEAFAALNEFANHAADPEVRELLAQYLLTHNETAEALAQLLEAYRARLAGDQYDKTAELREKILALDPDADLASIEAEATTNAPAGGPDEIAEGSAHQESAAGVDAIDGTEDGASLLPQETDGDEHDPLEGATIVLPELTLQTAADSAGIDAMGQTPVQTTGVELDLTVVVAPTPPEPVAPLLDLEAAAGDLTDSAAEYDYAAPSDHAADVADDAGLDLTGDSTGPDLTVDLAGLDLADATDPLAAGTLSDATLPDSGLVDAALPDADLTAAMLFEPPEGDGGLDAAMLESAPQAPAPTVSVGGEATANPGAGAGYVDFGAWLKDEIGAKQGETRYTVDAPTPSGDEDRDFLDMLAQFKSKVSEHLGDEDAQSRYDLGLAFKEMGLYDEAISQFQIAMRGLEDRLKIYEELGDCFIQKGDYTIALKILKGALGLEAARGGAELIGIHYQLGRTYEELGRTAEARDAYERVIAFDLEFRDASQRLARL